MIRWLSIAVLAFMIAGCASHPRVWSVDEMKSRPDFWSQSMPDPIRLIDHKTKKVIATIPLKTMRAMVRTHDDIAVAASQTSGLYLIENDAPNASAGESPKLGAFELVTLPMVKLLGQDKDEWAALFGHETAHLVHRDMQAKQERNAALQAISTIASVAVSATTGVNVGSGTDFLANMVGKSFSRNQERAADEASVPWMCAAGYDPQGAVRLQETLVKAAGGNSLAFLSDHPSGTERIQNLHDTIEKTPCATPRPTGREEQ